ncbi:MULTISPECIES: hypothetical protein [unclassified Pseudomonas]|uniref:hypothetical protein n=1 Tax=Pseudomonas TaxID=286 RepID=UPI000D0176B9|nr:MULTISPECIES: hypothetical protein [unclassified Pseudomonas]PRN05268.1 hypothetical protein A0O30_08250 [Pseudomonas sp. LLC-1]PYG72905.1 hypothetical protein N428_05142 [Pseudomonas sp. RV120224-01c]PYG77078.1 hypothetical protein N436_05240 [Pseudomonas sp. RV120224-01b]
MTDTIDKSTLAWIGGLLLGAVTTTATVVHMLHEQYITPLKIIESSQKIEKLTEQLNKQTASINTIKTLKEKLDKTQTKLAQIENSNLFAKGEIYPATLDVIEIGRAIEDIYKIYERKNLEETSEEPDRARIKVKLERSVFESIGYTYDTKTRKILTVSFVLDYQKELGDDFLLKSLTKSLGVPEKSLSKRQYRWTQPKGPNAYLMYDRYYVVMRDGYAPVLWREPGE